MSQMRIVHMFQKNSNEAMTQRQIANFLDLTYATVNVQLMKLRERWDVIEQVGTKTPYKWKLKKWYFKAIETVVIT